MELKKEVEALLFASAKALSMEELTTLLRKSEEEITEVADAIKKDYDDRDAPMMLIKEGNGFKISIRDQYVPTIQKIVVETELPKTIMETLAVIAYKHPALQAEIIKIRTNKAYDHLRELEELGYIVREKYGRTKKIKLTSKFFQYFDIPREKVKDAFSGFEEIEKVIEEKQIEAFKLRQEIKKKQEDDRKADKVKKVEDQVKSKELDKENKELFGNLEVVDELPEEPDEEEDDSVGGLKVVKVKPKKEVEVKEEEKKELSPQEKKVKEEREVKTEELVSKIEKDSDKRAEEIMQGKVSEPEKKATSELDRAEEEMVEEKDKLQEKDDENKS